MTFYPITHPVINVKNPQVDSSGLNVPPKSLSNVPFVAETNVPGSCSMSNELVQALLFRVTEQILKLASLLSNVLAGLVFQPACIIFRRCGAECLDDTVAAAALVHDMDTDSA